jgi:hypothetical protein
MYSNGKRLYHPRSIVTDHPLIELGKVRSLSLNPRIVSASSQAGMVGGWARRSQADKKNNC